MDEMSLMRGCETNTMMDRAVNASAMVRPCSALVQKTAAAMMTMGVNCCATPAGRGRFVSAFPLVQGTKLRRRGGSTDDTQNGDEDSELGGELQLRDAQLLDDIGEMVRQAHHLDALDLREHGRSDGDPLLHALVPGHTCRRHACGEFGCESSADYME